ncbi:DiGeorge syndrome critical region protein 14 [Clydaea vesicula]|uniref:DiGeorge syndrome critical region protein 14 n=1 Tax=Clydaea vesicula TaxID=447962 RepID=A0AAD5U3U7_9FUNG|nr:DiGeorge syndrome critical region protein 14 [Clydaea vesicula]KAJ3390152.1 DiGeorge syndrome critical region protein 14 [Lobulomyces angularis]
MEVAKVNVESKEVALSSNKNNQEKSVQLQSTILTKHKLYSTPLPEKKKPKVLEEDDYLDAISNIVERDFFPNLKTMKQQNAMLTGISVLEENEKNNSAISTDNITLDKFQHMYTSEDNASFEEIIKNVNEEKKRKYNWIFNKEKNVLELEGPSTDKFGNQGPLSILDAKSKKTGQIEYCRFDPVNPLMNYPKGIPTTIEDLQNMKGPNKKIMHDSTRFPEHFTKQSLDERRIKTQQLYDKMKSNLATPSMKVGDETPDTLPKVQGYGFVSATPSPAPNRDIDPEELMTWGFIDSTPLLMDSGGDHSGPKFQMPQTPRREVIGSKLSEKASKNIRKRAGLTKEATPKLRSGWTSDSTPGRGYSPYTKLPENSKSRMLSPAAQTLLSKSRSGLKSSLAISGNFGNNEAIKNKVVLSNKKPNLINNILPKKKSVVSTVNDTKADTSNNLTDNLL